MKAKLVSDMPLFEDETITEGHGKNKKTRTVRRRTRPGRPHRWTVPGQKQSYRTARAAERAFASSQR